MKMENAQVLRLESTSDDSVRTAIAASLAEFDRIVPEGLNREARAMLMNMFGAGMMDTEVFRASSRPGQIKFTCTFAQLGLLVYTAHLLAGNRGDK